MPRTGRPPKPPGTHRIQIRGSLSPEAARALVKVWRAYGYLHTEEVDAFIGKIEAALPAPKRRRPAT